MENKEKNYESLLEEAYKKIRPVTSRIERFEIPKVEGHIEGNKTIITNFKQICDYIRRDSQHLLKFLLREVAAAGSIKSDRLILSKIISSKILNDKIKDYIDEFVLCKECKKSDTEFLRRDRLLFVHCLACGARHSVRAKI